MNLVVGLMTSSTEVNVSAPAIPFPIVNEITGLNHPNNLLFGYLATVYDSSRSSLYHFRKLHFFLVEFKKKKKYNKLE